jgi:diacylglycerol kinase (ATP)
MKDLLVILNPAAGRRSHEHTEATLTDALKQSGLKFDLQTTKGPEHATTLVLEAPEKTYRTFLAVGGDGTVSEVINGLIRRKEQGRGNENLAIYTLGSGNDFAANIGAPTQLADLVPRLKAPVIRAADLGRLTLDGKASYFINNVGIGFEANVTIRSKKIRCIRGLPLYLAATLGSLRDRVSSNLSIQLTGPEGEQQWTESAMMLSIANGARTGGGFRIVPRAIPDDGWMDVLLIPPRSRIRMIALLLRVLRGRHTADSDLTFRRASHLRIDCSPALAVHADGEVLSTAAERIEIELLPQAIRTVV